jgi:hypothetical protein
VAEARRWMERVGATMDGARRRDGGWSAEARRWMERGRGGAAVDGGWEPGMATEERIGGSGRCGSG